MAWPYRVVTDQPGLLALYIPRGATYLRWSPRPGGSRELGPARWRRDTLRLMFPGLAYSLWLSWDGGSGEGREFHGYYLNMEEPYRRTAIGVDTNDHTLDAVIAPDRSWSWKDLEDLDARVRDGIYSAPFAAELRSVAAEALARFERRDPPFDGAWETWTPDPAWPLPELHPAWRDEPVTLWPRRRWAYLDID
jgi:hypothetical protein